MSVYPQSFSNLESLPAGAGSGWRERARWACLSSVLSALMLGAIALLAARPGDPFFYSAAPPAIYAVATVIAFAPGAAVVDRLVSRALPIVAVPVAVTLVLRATGPSSVLGPLYLGVFFLVCLAFSRRIARERPADEGRGRFYLWAATGMLSGVPIGVVLAPIALPGIDLFAVAVVAACGLMERRTAYRERPLSEFSLPAAAGLLTFVVVGLLPGPAAPVPLLVGALAVPALLCFRVSKRPATFAGSLALMLVAGGGFGTDWNGPVAAGMWAFFGIFRVRFGSPSKITGPRRRDGLWAGVKDRESARRTARLGVCCFQPIPVRPRSARARHRDASARAPQTG
ncbi:MAG: hypothetical protein ACE148_15620 [Vicinamibacterales bacterium]